jgi:hypothetical protein
MPTDYVKFMLALMVWREMRSCPKAWRMVIWTVLNRANARTPAGRPMWWGGDPLSVILHPFQYSSMTAKGDGQTVAWPQAGDLVWPQIVAEVDVALNTDLVPIQTSATHYFSYPLIAPPAAWGKCHLVPGGDFGRSAQFYALD